jgi:citrate lyase beta subunit
MPAKKDIVSKIKNKSIPGLTTMVMCFEDAISDQDLPEAEANVQTILDDLAQNVSSGAMSLDDLPLYFLRVRNPQQFRCFTNKLTPSQVNVLTGFIFPKFNSSNGYDYLSHLEELNNRYDGVLYGMPILESSEIAYAESRIYELNGIKNLLTPYRDLILNVRVGATDFSSTFGVRRGIHYSIYDILTVRDCLSDILNCFSREGEDYIVSAPVWEYFSSDKFQQFADDQQKNSLQTSLLRRQHIVNEAVDGLLREVILDKANGFVGKTVIHPSHLKYVNAMQAVTFEEYEDATQILQSSGGVAKGFNNNKMNETNPHRNWAKRTVQRADVYGVIKNDRAYADLFA